LIRVNPASRTIAGGVILGIVGSSFGALVGIPAFVLGYLLQPDDD
jgi:hypothetical protein